MERDDELATVRSIGITYGQGFLLGRPQETDRCVGPGHKQQTDHESGRAGIVVDKLFGGAQMVMNPMGRLLMQVLGVSGSSILGNGRVALILDIQEIIRRAVCAEQQRSQS